MCKTATFHGSRSMREFIGDSRNITVGYETRPRMYGEEVLKKEKKQKSRRKADRNGEEIND